MHSFVHLSPTTFLERSANAFPDRTALVHAHGKTTFAELRDRSRRLARALARQQVAHGDRVALLLENGIHTIEAHFAIPALGAMVVMLNPWLSESDTLGLLEYSKPRVLITDSATLQRIAGTLSSSTFTLPKIILTDRPAAHTEGDATLDYEDCLRSEDAHTALDSDIRSELDPIAINFTSGTTGKPKGVTYTHRAAYLHAIGQVLMLGLARDSHYLWTLPMFHVSGWGHIWGNVAVASTQTIPATSVVQGMEAGLIETIRSQGITHVAGSPRLLRSLVDAAQGTDSLRGLTAQTGGASPPTTLIRQLEDHGVRLLHQYGLNETCGPYVVAEEQDEWQTLAPEQRAQRRARQGVAAIHAGTGLRVIDDGGNDVPHDGVSLGEVVMAGNTVATGYYNNPEATQKAFRNGWFHSGDVAVVHPDGALEIRDRMKDLIHVETEYGWENVSSIEIENVLSRNAAIRDAAVVAVPAEASGAGRQTIVAFAELQPGQTLHDDEFHAYCAAELSSYKRPDQMYVAAIPKTSTGKVRKDLLVAEATKRLVESKARTHAQSVSALAAEST